jgi:hypothetical protein
MLINEPVPERTDAVGDTWNVQQAIKDKMILDLQSMETRPPNAKNVLLFLYFVGCRCLLLICFARRKSQICSLLILSMHSRSSWEISKHNSFVNNQVTYGAGEHMEAKNILSDTGSSTSLAPPEMC